MSRQPILNDMSQSSFGPWESIQHLLLAKMQLKPKDTHRKHLGPKAADPPIPIPSPSRNPRMKSSTQMHQQHGARPAFASCPRSFWSTPVYMSFPTSAPASVHMHMYIRRDRPAHCRQVFSLGPHTHACMHNYMHVRVPPLAMCMLLATVNIQNCGNPRYRLALGFRRSNEPRE